MVNVHIVYRLWNSKDQATELTTAIAKLQGELDACPKHRLLAQKLFDSLSEQCRTRVRSLFRILSYTTFVVDKRIRKQLNDLSKTESYDWSFGWIRRDSVEEIDMTPIDDLHALVEHQEFLVKLPNQEWQLYVKALLNKTFHIIPSWFTYWTYFPTFLLNSHEMTASISQFGRPMDFVVADGIRNVSDVVHFRDVLQSIRWNVCAWWSSWCRVGCCWCSVCC
jgi:hypothetical protein